jgi:uncharacterized membrane protein YhiD involved in acid resistance
MDSTADLAASLLYANPGVLFSWPTVVLNCVLAAVLGLCTSVTYKHTHQGLSYSRSFVVMLVLLTVVSAIAMMVIGNNIAKAFALVGALSIIRFRTVIKDTRDIVFIFASLVSGMASGTSSYFIAVFGTGFVLLVVILLDLREFGSLVKKEFVLRLDAKRSVSEEIIEIGREFAESMTALELEGTPTSNEYLQLTYDVVLKADADMEKFIRKIQGVEEVKNIRFIASRQDIDY